MAIPDSPTFVVQSPTSPISQFALRILVEGNEFDPEPIGTAVWICGHLVLTARHNIEYIIKKYGAVRSGQNKNIAEISNYSVRLYQVWPNADYAIWEIREAWCSGESDLALMSLSLWGHTGEQPPDPAFGLSMRGLPPPKGSKVSGFGYHSITTAIKRHPDGNYHLDLNDVPQATSGQVTDVFPLGRDRVMYPFPCFQVNARFDHGMSGGPVFDESGKLVGIICGSLQSSDLEETISYVAAIWPALRILIQGKKAGHPKPEQLYPAVDLAIDGILSVSDLSELDPAWFPGRNLKV